VFRAYFARASIASALALWACGGAEEPSSSGRGRASTTADACRDFADESLARGLDHVNRCGEAAKRTILEANGAGVAALDLELDGDLDLVFAQGLASLAQLASGPGADLEVFLNHGRGVFSRASGPGLSGWWTGLAAGDVDGDGDSDLVAGGFGALRVLLQDERGALVPAADLMPDDARSRCVPGEPREAGHPPLWATSLALFDADRDGELDLYAGQYLELDPVAPPIGALGQGSTAVPCRWKGYEVYCGPHGMKPQPDRFFRGLGGGAFADETARALPGHVPGFTLAVAPFDFDCDGDDDVYVANDSVANLLLVNDGRGVFRDAAYEKGVALSSDGRAEAGMGIAFGDVDRDLDLDFALTNFSGEPSSIYFGSPRGVSFADETFRFGLARESRALLSWSVHLADFDGDTWLELFTANGHVYPQADLPDTGTRYAQPDTLWRLSSPAGERRLERIEPTCDASILAAVAGSRGSALGDFDLDLAPDLAVTRIDGPAALGMNRFPRAHRLAVRLLGPLASERGGARPCTPADGMGARAVLAFGAGSARVQVLAQVETAVGYQSASTPWLHFGLGQADRYSSLRVMWPSGRVEELGPGAANRRITVREGRGIVAEEAVP
jgi:hypothetical protein